ncbi:MAG: hypothetical protein G01um101417_109 [Parcubacteria group bacterium Gr01-1014_17]|nr:MAG: hypothetical protein G01um101417_109 [Parcubacteria group bacterium Gr01-1014_17]
MKIQWKITLGVFVLFFAAFVQYLIMRGKNQQEPIVESNGTLASTTVPEVSINDPSGGGYKVQSIPLPQVVSVPQAPNLDALVAGIVAKNDYEKLILSNLTNAQDSLKNNPTNYDAWLTAGMSLKQLERYEASRDAFLYVATLWPTQPVPQGNLGSLYHLYLKDFTKSETAYKKAIALDPTQPGWHRGLYELYRYSYKLGTNAWEDALKQGILETGSIDLMAVLAGRYADLKRFEESVAQYDRAIAEAERQGNAKLVDMFIGYRAEARAQMK